MNDREFSKSTEKIRAMLPYWFSMKKKPKDSIGLNFLRVFGFELDDIEKIMEHAYNQTKIDRADIYYKDILYKINLPVYFNIDSIKKIESKLVVLRETKSLFDLFNLAENIGIHSNIEQPNCYFIDKNSKIIYVTEPYDCNIKDKFGKLSILVNDGEDDKHISFDLELHNVWNFFDEFGALLNCPRLIGEKNIYYKERILDVFKNPASSTRYGLLNGIARELSLRKKIVVEDETKDIIIKDRMVVVDTIKINEEPVHIDKIFETTEGYILIKAHPSYKNAIVSYIAGVKMFSLINHNSEDDNLLYNADGSLTTDMMEYKNKVKSESSILFNEFKYDYCHWVNTEDNMNEEHYLFDPYNSDSNIKGFKNYKLCKGGCV